MPCWSGSLVRYSPSISTDFFKAKELKRWRISLNLQPPGLGARETLSWRYQLRIPVLPWTSCWNFHGFKLAVSISSSANFRPRVGVSCSEIRDGKCLLDRPTLRLDSSVSFTSWMMLHL
ncbi:hypothetical protein SDJN03_06132, partial [Cucurbita argyrosperma subsp. sororia]